VFHLPAVFADGEYYHHDDCSDPRRRLRANWHKRRLPDAVFEHVVELASEARRYHFPRHGTAKKKGGQDKMNLKELIFGKNIRPEGVNTGGRYANSVQKWLPIADIRDGVVITTDGRFIKILEALPVNFYLKSTAEQQNIIFYFASYLKIAPDNIQILAVTQKADIEAYIRRMKLLHEEETDISCREMIEDNISEVEYLADREALTRRFFIVIQYEQRMRVRGNSFSAIIQRLNEEADTARHYLDMCGLEVLQPEYSDLFLCETLYALLNRKTSKSVKLPCSVFSMLGEVHECSGEL